jgi:enoyl-[acyl-carrier protein] reductase II
MQIDPVLVLSTPVCEVLGIHYPVLQAGMSVAGNGRLAAAVADAGGLGTIGSNQGGAAKDDQMAAVRQELRLARSITDGVISVNIPMVYGRGEELLEIAREEGAQAVSVTAGSPTTLAHSAHEYGLIVLGVVGSVAQAQKAQDAGVDVLVVEGTEAGGLNHPDCISVLPLLPKISDAVSTPLVAAGGFADGRGLAAALMLGASAVQMGTRFLATDECHIHQNSKQAIVDAGADGTFLLWGGRHFPRRTLNTPYAKTMLEAERSQVATGKLHPGGDAQMDGDLEAGVLTVGMSSYLIDDIQPAGEIVRSVVRQAITTLGEATRYVYP